jgi:hypothetical protein
VGLITDFVFASFYQILHPRMVFLQTVGGEDIKKLKTFGATGFK